LRSELISISFFCYTLAVLSRLIEFYPEALSKMEGDFLLSTSSTMITAELAAMSSSLL